MKITKESAEIIGMFAADGCLQEEYICIWGNIIEDRDYYDQVVCPLFSLIFNKKITAHAKKSNSVYGFYLCGKNIVQQFRDLGFLRNKTYTVRVPQFILNSSDKDLISSFVRGYADCDGNINFLRRKGKYKLFKTKYNTYPRIQIVSVSKQVIEDISYLLNKLDIKHRINKKKPKTKNEKEQAEIVIRGVERVESFIEKIGFNNPAQKTKYLVWKKFGMCPPRTTLEQRKGMLQDKINPFLL